MDSKTGVFIGAIALVGLLTACGAARQPDAVEKAAREMNLPVAVTQVKSSLARRHGHVNVRIDYLNISSKPIQRVRFVLSARNATDDSIPNKATDRFSVTLEDTGRVEPGGRREKTWKAAWENRNVVCFLIMQTNVEFSDGTGITSYVDQGKPYCR
ncbi:MAG: hypothetical protein GY703_18300 [Gammaproteobacteria bacterium]|nr:hypothetical protein [Gammaproteobacteria bacterium]